MRKFSKILLTVALGFSVSACGFGNQSRAENQIGLIENSKETALPDTLPPPVNLTTENVGLKIGENDLFAVINTGKTAKPLYFNMHDDENTSVQAAKSVADQQGGKVIELAHTGKRLITFNLKGKSYTIDPNRIFTKKGITETLKKNSKTTPEAEAEVEKFAQKLIADFLKQTDVIIAIHNNTDNAYSAKSYEAGGENATDAAQVFINPANDVDDFFFVTEEKHFQKLKEKGFNVILQDNANVTDDGSLSVYCGQAKITYINVEAQHGHLIQQIKMLETLSEVLAN